jgi:sugar lactone lactonase YvrE
MGLSVDPTNSFLYVADETCHTIIRYSFSSSIVSTVAGITNSAGFSGDNGLATSAQLYYPQDVKADGSGNFYIADLWNNRIRKVTAAGVISTIVGTGSNTYNGDGTGTSVNIYQPNSLVLSSNYQNLYLSDSYLGRIRLYSISSHSVTTLVSGLSVSYSGGNPLVGPSGVAIDVNGNLLYSDSAGNYINVYNFGTQSSTQVAGNGGTACSSNGLSPTLTSIYTPRNIVTDAMGNIYIAEQGNQRIRLLYLPSPPTSPVPASPTSVATATPTSSPTTSFQATLTSTQTQSNTPTRTSTGSSSSVLSTSSYQPAVVLNVSPATGNGTYEVVAPTVKYGVEAGLASGDAC